MRHLSRFGVLSFLPILACSSVVEEESASEEALDLSVVLDASESRAGVVTRPQELFGGISASGAPGDIKIYNDRVRFIIEAVGDSDYYVDYGGGLIDADVVRPDGAPGRDFLDELGPMVSLGRVQDATDVTIVNDGSTGPAHVRVTGRGAPMRLITGAVENPDIVPDHDLTIVCDYVLAPGSWMLEVTTTVTNDDDVEFASSIGLFDIFSGDLAAIWTPRGGFDGSDGKALSQVASVGSRNEGVFSLMAASGEVQPSLLGDVVSSFAAGTTAFGPAEVIAPGGEASWSALVGVGPDIATLETERLARNGEDTTQLTGVVSSAQGPVAGARVHLLNSDGEPIGMAVTGPSGEWSAPAAGVDRWVATGRGQALLVDLPAGHGNVSPYDRSADDTLTSLESGALPVPFAEGYGVAGTEAPETLTAPGVVDLTIADGGPATVLVDFLDGDAVATDSRLVPGRPSGRAAIAFVRTGRMQIPLEPGRYRVTVHRGIRYELHQEDVTVTSSETVAATATLTRAYELPGVLTFDPHQHASPSGDGSIPMEERLVVAAASGIDIHVGTDHDHIADYNPALARLGLGDWLVSVVADEVSPVLRGHFNAYPAQASGRMNGGAPRWWQGVESTSALFTSIRAILAPNGVIQANHPLESSGLFSAADYDPSTGEVGDANRWSTDFDAVEVNNSGGVLDNLRYYADLTARGLVRTPVGVSDSHSHTGGDPGLNLTFLRTGGTLAEFNDDALTAAMAARATVVSRGPYIDATLAGAWAPGATVAPGALDVRVLAPSWMPVETVALLRDGNEIARVTCAGAAPEPCTTRFDLPADADGSYIVVAESSTPMSAVWTGTTAWAATSAILVDADANGWTAPLPPITGG